MNLTDFIRIEDIQLKVENETSRTVILKEHPEADSSLVMIVGEGEFLALAKEKGLIQTPRPLTHELYLDLLAATEIRFLRVEIYDLRDQAYLAAVIYGQGGEEKRADARPSDALALALRRRLPIWVHKKTPSSGIDAGTDRRLSGSDPDGQVLTLYFPSPPAVSGKPLADLSCRRFGPLERQRYSATLWRKQGIQMVFPTA